MNQTKIENLEKQINENCKKIQKELKAIKKIFRK
jgi:hypothetical protein